MSEKVKPPRVPPRLALIMAQRMVIVDESYGTNNLHGVPLWKVYIPGAGLSKYETSAEKAEAARVRAVIALKDHLAHPDTPVGTRILARPLPARGKKSKRKGA